MSIPVLLFQCDIKLALYNITQGGRAHITVRLQFWTAV